MFGQPGTVNHPPAPSYLEGLYMETDSNEYYFWGIGVICFAYLFFTLRDFAMKINYQEDLAKKS
jgi:hypothetical protein